MRTQTPNTFKLASVAASMVVLSIAASPQSSGAVTKQSDVVPRVDFRPVPTATSSSVTGSSAAGGVLQPLAVPEAQRREAPARAVLAAPHAPSSTFTVLYSQLDSQDPSTAISQNFEPVFDAYDSQLADDFVVPAGQSWQVQALVVSGTYSASGGPLSINVNFYPDAGGLPSAAAACSFPGIVDYSDSGGNFFILLPGAGCTLTSGTFWVSVQVNLEFQFYGEWFWRERAIQSNNVAVWRNPGGGWGTPCSDWSPRQGCLGGAPDQAFDLLGAVPGCSAILVLGSDTLPAGTTGAVYSQAIAVSGGTAPYTYSVAGVLPPGLDLDTATGVLSGTPVKVGSYSFTVAVTDAAGCPGGQTYSMLVYGPPATFRSSILMAESHTDTLNFTSVTGIRTLNDYAPVLPATAFDYTADLALLPTDTHHVYQLTANGKTSRYDVNGVNTPLTSLPPLPSGEQWTDMATDRTTGVVYAVEANCGSYSYLYRVDLIAGTADFVGNIGDQCLIGLASDNSGQLYGYGILSDKLLSINKTNGAGTIIGPIGFDAGFGQSMDCDPATGLCYLFAFNAATNRAELRRANLATGATTNLNFIGSVYPRGTLQAAGTVFGSLCAEFTLSPASPLPAGSAGVPYSQSISATGGTGPYAYVVQSGTLPPGLTLNSASGLLSGTPTGSGPYSFTVKATDTPACTGSQEYTITIAPSPREASPGKDMRATKGPGTTVALTYAPACEASDHVVYWGTGPIVGALSWTNAACGLGTTGSASFDPGNPPANGMDYFVIVGQNGVREGAYGQRTGGTEEPEAVGVGACDQPRVLAGSCP